MPDRPWADPASLVRTIAAGTVAVPDVAGSVSAYRQAFRYVEHWRGDVSEEMANFWGTPAMAGRAAAVVGPSGFTSGLIRFVELGEDFQSIPSHTTRGWAALEIRVRDADAMVAQVAGSQIEHTGGPSDLKFGVGPPTLRPVQFRGPSGEPLYFTEDLQFDRSKLIGSDNVGGIFLQTIVAVPFTQTRDFYMRTLAMQLRAQVKFPRAQVAESLGLEKNRMYYMTSVRAPQYCAIQVDEYPDEIMARPAAPGCLPPGVCMCTLQVRDLDLVAAALGDSDVPFNQIESNSIPPGAGGRALACRGFSGEFVEFVES